MYQLTSGTSVINIDTGTTIPADPGNADYQAYLAWVAQGNAAQPYVAPDPVVPIPDLATQLAAALIQANVISASAIDPATLQTINTNLTAAGQATIAMPANKITS